MGSSASAGLVWLSQLGRAVKCVKVNMINALTHILVKILEVALLNVKEYEVKVKVEETS